MLYQLSYLGDPRRSVAACRDALPWRVCGPKRPYNQEHGPGHPRSRPRRRGRRPGSIPGAVHRAHHQPGMARPGPLAGRRLHDRSLRPTLLRAGRSPPTSARPEGSDLSAAGVHPRRRRRDRCARARLRPPRPLRALLVPGRSSATPTTRSPSCAPSTSSTAGSPTSARSNRSSSAGRSSSACAAATGSRCTRRARSAAPSGPSTAADGERRSLELPRPRHARLAAELPRGRGGGDADLARAPLPRVRAVVQRVSRAARWTSARRAVGAIEAGPLRPPLDRSRGRRSGRPAVRRPDRDPPDLSRRRRHG